MTRARSRHPAPMHSQGMVESTVRDRHRPLQHPSPRRPPLRGQASPSHGTKKQPLDGGRSSRRAGSRSAKPSLRPSCPVFDAQPATSGRTVPPPGSRPMFHVKQRAWRSEFVRICVSLCASPRFSFLKPLSAGKLVSVGRERRCHGGIWLSQRRGAPLGRSGAADPVVHRVRSDKGCCWHGADLSYRAYVF
jgi:hypothetical protein